MKRVVEFLLLFVPLFGVLLWLGGDVGRLRFGRRRVEERERRIADDVLLTRRGYFVRRMGRWSLRRYNAAGELLLEAAADDAQAISTDTFSLKNLTAVMFNHKKNQRLAVNAPQAEVKDEPKLLSGSLFGGVRLQITTRERALKVLCERLQFVARSPQDITLHADCPITLKLAGTKVQAAGLEGTTKTGKYSLKGPVLLETRTQDGRQVKIKAKEALIDTADRMVVLVEMHDVEGGIEGAGFAAGMVAARLEEGKLISLLAAKGVTFTKDQFKLTAKGLRWLKGRGDFIGSVHIKGEALDLNAESVTLLLQGEKVLVKATGGLKGHIEQWQVKAPAAECILATRPKAQLERTEICDVDMRRADGLSVRGERVVVRGQRISGKFRMESGGEWLEAVSLVVEGERFSAQAVRGNIDRGGLSGRFTAEKAKGSITRVFGEYLLDVLHLEGAVLRTEGGTVLTAGAADWDGRLLTCTEGVVVRGEKGLLRAPFLRHTPSNGRFEVKSPHWQDEQIKAEAKAAEGLLREGRFQVVRARSVRGEAGKVRFRTGLVERRDGLVEMSEDVRVFLEGGEVAAPKALFDPQKRLLKAERAEGWFLHREQKAEFVAQDVRVEVDEAGRVDRAEFGRVELRMGGMVVRAAGGRYFGARGVVELRGGVEAEGRTEGGKRFFGRAEEAELRLAESVVWLREGARAEFGRWKVECGFGVAFLKDGRVVRVYLGGGVKARGGGGERIDCTRAVFEKGIWSAEGEPAVFRRGGVVVREKHLVYDTEEEEVRAKGGYDWQLDPALLERFKKK